MIIMIVIITIKIMKIKYLEQLNIIIFAIV